MNFRVGSFAFGNVHAKSGVVGSSPAQTIALEPLSNQQADGRLRGISWSLADLVQLRNAGAHMQLPRQHIRRGHEGGARRSRFRGRGIDFDEVRVYQLGDDVRSIDWRVTARKGAPHTKVFREERERPVNILIDLRAGMAFGSRQRFKSVAAAEAAAVLAWTALEQGDRVGGGVIGTSTRVTAIGADGLVYERPQRSQRSVIRLLQNMVDAMPGSAAKSADKEMELTQACARLEQSLGAGSLCYLISDFADLNQTNVAALQRLARRSELVLLEITDPLERELPPPGLYPIDNAGRHSVLDTATPQTRMEHTQRFARRQILLESLARLPHVMWVHLSVEQSLLTDPGLWPWTLHR